MKSNNTELLFLLKIRDPKGIELLYEYYASAVYGTVFRIVKDSAVADKVIQNCFVEIWKTFDMYDVVENELFMFIICMARKQAHKVNSQNKANTSNRPVLQYSPRVYHSSSAWCMSSLAMN